MKMLKKALKIVIYIIIPIFSLFVLYPTIINEKNIDMQHILMMVFWGGGILFILPYSYVVLFNTRAGNLDGWREVFINISLNGIIIAFIFLFIHGFIFTSLYPLFIAPMVLSYSILKEYKVL